ncbi:MAG: Rne/Rng family ribonuclease [Candidatus Omnitrophica bacterium]|nr:Rne/Rng family ribonuclease [Candidatus Omnitrophota bacterium]
MGRFRRRPQPQGQPLEHREHREHPSHRLHGPSSRGGNPPAPAATGKEILINVEPMETRLAIVEDGALEEFFVERTAQAPIVGNVYKGKVSSVVPGIRAAFVDMGIGKNGFLYLTDIVNPSPELAENVQLDPPQGAQPPPVPPEHQPRIQDLVKVGQELLVQVVKEPLGTKGPRLTTHLTLPGRFMVLMPMDSHFGISKKIEDHAERDRLRQMIKDFNPPKDIGLIIRTAASGADEKQIQRDLRFLLALWNRIKARSMRAQAPALIHQEYDVILRTVRDMLGDDIKRVVVDSRDEFRTIHRFLCQTDPHLRDKIEWYREPEPLLEKHGLEQEIERIYHRKVELPSGGYCVIEQTESLVAIDVNSGKFTGRKNLEETAFVTNMEAAQEIAKQIRLRDMGGILIFDFIDMVSQSHRQKVFNALQQGFRKDRAKTNVIFISEFGLVEMTRQRIRKSLESVSFHECPYCHGRGKVRSALTMSVIALRQAKKIFLKNHSRAVELTLNPEVASRLQKEDRHAVQQVERTYRGRIEIKSDPAVHLEEIRAVPLDKS